MNALIDGDDRVDDRVEDRGLHLETAGQDRSVTSTWLRDVAAGGEDQAVAALTAPLDPTVLAVSTALAIAELHQRGVGGGDQTVELSTVDTTSSGWIRSMKGPLCRSSRDQPICSGHAEFTICHVPSLPRTDNRSVEFQKNSPSTDASKLSLDMTALRSVSVWVVETSPRIARDFENVLTQDTTLLSMAFLSLRIRCEQAHGRYSRRRRVTISSRWLDAALRKV